MVPNWGFAGVALKIDKSVVVEMFLCDLFRLDNRRGDGRDEISILDVEME